MELKNKSNSLNSNPTSNLLVGRDESFLYLPQHHNSHVTPQFSLQHHTILTRHQSSPALPYVIAEHNGGTNLDQFHLLCLQAHLKNSPPPRSKLAAIKLRWKALNKYDLRNDVLYSLLARIIMGNEWFWMISFPDS